VRVKFAGGTFQDALLSALLVSSELNFAVRVFLIGRGMKTKIRLVLANIADGLFVLVLPTLETELEVET